MFKALITGGSPRENTEAATTALLHKLAPSKRFSKNMKDTSNTHHGPDKARPKEEDVTLKKTTSKVHPKKKATTEPDFSIYSEYVKEAGTWDMRAKMPVVFCDRVCFY
ncbi:cyclic nucleotide-gated channel 18 [Striga asiatica]|uniref:Cyclic nucleotide-gated channel 18 n=1 Tax=Striga asiatica TaxID=4170 RepID=A0A5A7QUZ2_STRAF|nr:cyclic nucleotide-gated channel 18 [Striga asiatica]